MQSVTETVEVKEKEAARTCASEQLVPGDDVVGCLLGDLHSSGGGFRNGGIRLHPSHVHHRGRDAASLFRIGEVVPRDSVVSLPAGDQYTAGSGGSVKILLTTPIFFLKL